MTAGLVACGSGTPSAPEFVPITYGLLSVNGVDLPVAASLGSMDSLTAGSVKLLTADSAEVDETTVSPPAHGLPGIEGTTIGLYRVLRAHDSLVFQPYFVGDVTDTAVVSGSVLTLFHHKSTGASTVRVQVYTAK